MKVNLSNVNISLEEFQRMSRGDFNAGEVRLAGENKLEKVNNHVRFRFLNNKTINHAEVIAIKNAFVNALESNGVNSDRLQDIRQKLGLEGENGAETRRLSMKPLTRQQIREIIDANAKEMTDLNIETSDTIYAGGKMSSDNVAKREKVNAALAEPTRKLDESGEISAFQALATDQMYFVKGNSNDYLETAKKMLDALMEGCKGKPRADVDATATITLQSGQKMTMTTGMSELEFSRKLENAIIKLIDGCMVDDVEYEAFEDYEKLETAQDRYNFFEDLIKERNGELRARAVGMKILYQAGVTDYETFDLINSVPDDKIIPLVKYLDGIRNYPGNEIENDPTFREMTAEENLVPREKRSWETVNIPVVSGYTFNSTIHGLMADDPDNIPLASFRNMAMEANDLVLARLGKNALAENPMKPVSGNELSKAMKDNSKSDFKRVILEESRDGYLNAALVQGAVRLVRLAIDKAIAAQKMPADPKDVYNYVMAKNEGVIGRIANSQTPADAERLVNGLADHIRDSINFCKFSNELEKLSGGILDTMRGLLADKLGIDKQSAAKFAMPMQKLQIKANRLKSSIKDDILAGKAQMKPIDEYVAGFKKLAQDFVDKVTGPLERLKDVKLPPAAASRFKLWMMRGVFSSKIDFAKLQDLARNANLKPIEDALANLKTDLADIKVEVELPDEGEQDPAAIKAAKDAAEKVAAEKRRQCKLKVRETISNAIDPILREIFNAAGATGELGIEDEYEPVAMFMVFLGDARPEFAKNVLEFIKDSDVRNAMEATGLTDLNNRPLYYFMPLTTDPNVNVYIEAEQEQADALFPAGR